MERLKLHPLASEFIREVIEQFGMAWPAAVDAEVVRSLDDAAAEMCLPDTIHVNARCQRVGRINQPLRQGQARILFAN